MRTKLSILAAAVAALDPLPPPIRPACYDLDVVVNGDAVVDEEGCEELPELP